MKSATTRIRALLSGLAAALSLAIFIAAAPDAFAAWVYQGDLDTSGKYALREPFAIAVDQTGGIFVADTAHHRIVKFAHGKRKAFGSLGSGRGQLEYPQGVAVQDVGNGKTWVYVTDWGNSRIEVFDDDGHFVKTFGEAELNRPWGIAVVPQSDGSPGDVYVTVNPPNDIAVFSAEGAFKTSFTCTSCPEGPFHGLGGVAVRRTGDQSSAFEVYAGDDDYDNYHGRVLVMDPSGQWQVTYGGDSGANQLNGPDGVAVDPLDNTTWVVDAGASKLLRFGPSGEVLTSYAGTAGSDELSDPQGIALYTVPRTFGQPAILYVVNTETALVHIYKEVPGKLGAITAQNQNAWVQNKTAYFTVFYSGIEQTCTGTGAQAKVIVDPSAANPEKFTLNGGTFSGAISRAGGGLQMTMTDRDTKLVDKAWAGGKQIKITLTPSAQCEDDSHVENSITLYM